MIINSKRVLKVSLDCLAAGAIAIVAGFVLGVWQTANDHGIVATDYFKPADVFPAWPHWALIGLGALLLLTGAILALVRYITEESA